MIVIADSGATKTDWCFCNHIYDKDTKVADNSLRIKTLGVNAATMDNGGISTIIDDAITKAGGDIIDRVEAIYFYGAGCIKSQNTEALYNILRKKIPHCGHIEIESDLVGAAKALFGDGKGVAAIMGTGSNSCLWNKGQIIRNIRPGGFILGDEGSGACLGKLFLSDYFKDLVPEGFKQKVDNVFKISYQDSVKRIYKGEAPSRYLASFAKFIVDNKSDNYAKGLIDYNIRNFIERSLVRYGESEIGVIGSLGSACKEELISIGAEYGLKFTKFIISPIDSLVEYHLGQIVDLKKQNNE